MPESKEPCGPGSLPYEHSFLSVRLVTRNEDERAEISICRNCGRSEVSISVLRGYDEESATTVISLGVRKEAA